MTSCDITVDTSTDPVRVILSGEIDRSNRAAVATALQTVITDPTVTGIQVDLAGLTFIDAAGIRLLTTTRQRAGASGKHLRVTGARGHVATVLEVVGVADLLAGGPPARRPHATGRFVPGHGGKQAAMWHHGA